MKTDEPMPGDDDPNWYKTMKRRVMKAEKDLRINKDHLRGEIVKRDAVIEELRRLLDRWVNSQITERKP